MCVYKMPFLKTVPPVKVAESSDRPNVRRKIGPSHVNVFPCSHNSLHCKQFIFLWLDRNRNLQFVFNARHQSTILYAVIGWYLTCLLIASLLLGERPHFQAVFSRISKAYLWELLGLFVLNFMYISCQFQIWKLKFTIWKFLTICEKKS